MTRQLKRAQQREIDKEMALYERYQNSYEGTAPSLTGMPWLDDLVAKAQTTGKPKTIYHLGDDGVSTVYEINH